MINRKNQKFIFNSGGPVKCDYKGRLSLPLINLSLNPDFSFYVKGFSLPLTLYLFDFTRKGNCLFLAFPVTFYEAVSDSYFVKFYTIDKEKRLSLGVRFKDSYFIVGSCNDGSYCALLPLSKEEASSFRGKMKRRSTASHQENSYIQPIPYLDKLREEVDNVLREVGGLEELVKPRESFLKSK